MVGVRSEAAVDFGHVFRHPVVDILHGSGQAERDAYQFDALVNDDGHPVSETVLVTAVGEHCFRRAHHAREETYNGQQ